MMKSKIKKYLLIVVVSALVLAGCDSVKEPITEENTGVVEESTENESENSVEVSVEKGIEEESTEEKLINAEKVAALPIETVKIFEQIATAYQDGDYIGACNYANQLGVIGEVTDKVFALNELLSQLQVAGFSVMEEPALIGTINGTIGIYCDKHTVKLYCGDYNEGVREGKGILICHWLENPSYAVGEWKDDMPNGKQNIYKEQRWGDGADIETNIIECSGDVVNGLWDGEVNYNITEYIGEEICSCEIYTADFDNGKVKVLEERNSYNVIAYGSVYDSHGNIKEDNVEFIMINKNLTDKLYGCFWEHEDIQMNPAGRWR